MNSSDFSLQEAKRAVRRNMGEQRKRLSAEERSRLTEKATLQLLSLDELRGAKTVAGFVATQSEIDTLPVLAALRERGVGIVLPRVTSENITPRLRFHRYTHPSELTLGKFGLLEPVPDALEVPAHAIDVFIVPGLAFDRRGVRIGYGGGYYDECAAYVRAYPKTVSALFVGFAFNFQLLESCPSGEWDVPIDYVVTDARIIHCRESKD